MCDQNPYVKSTMVSLTPTTAGLVGDSSVAVVVLVAPACTQRRKSADSGLANKSHNNNNNNNNNNGACCPVVDDMQQQKEWLTGGWISFQPPAGGLAINKFKAKKSEEHDVQ